MKIPSNAIKVCPGVWELEQRMGPFRRRFDYKPPFCYSAYFETIIGDVINKKHIKFKEVHFNIPAHSWHYHPNSFLLCTQSDQPKRGTLIGLVRPSKALHTITDHNFRQVIQLKLNHVYIVESRVWHRAPYSLGATRVLYRCFDYTR